VKLLTFEKDGRSAFGAVLGDRVVAFDQLSAGRESAPLLKSVDRYLEHLPDSFERATELLAGVEASRMAGTPLEQVRILPPIPRPPALLDFGLTPRHLVRSARTLLRREFGPLVGGLAYLAMKRRIERASRSDTPLYYKGNHLAVIGNGDCMGWPAYTSYLDIEPELAVVVGSGACKIAGYTIFNDASARDVQFPEMMGSGPARSKDFADSNGLGPYLVTPDEIPDPLALPVSVTIGNRHTWSGHTAEYTARPLEVLEYYEKVFPPRPGTIVGMGTVPGCTGLDNDLWILPGERIEIRIEGLGTLCQRVPSKIGRLEKSRWKARPELAAYA
jgi:2-keto-4-pentenoate hydratase/2-oxohepta-3-ene-1,7-dioic acid hydratase in catechol pathway